ncbi:MAG: hypothetical protein P3T54_01975 [Dehalogenimonas sp.]|uniref:Uncharacterized protein n=1 Tax=Candidatus Dehalogenimonas loeffleri TaxID=3127115 RepID=A0ABZ2JAE2_9CHLR|nr:hypothetical protein [Dehalogenimonas sp.]
MRNIVSSLIIVTSIIAGIMLFVLMKPDSAPIITIGFLANLVVFIVALINLMRNRLRQLIIGGIAGGVLLLVIVANDVVGGTGHQLPVIVGVYSSFLVYCFLLGCWSPRES